MPEVQEQAILDPYRDWLDVRIPDRPLGAYQLLGLPLGEESEEEIEAAVRQKRELLRRFAGQGPRPLWQHLHRELNIAAETLLDPRRKAEYDRSLFPAGTTAASAAEPCGPLTCGSCDETNPSGRVFCSQCGESLLATCCRCGARSFAGETYCGACGANLKEVLRERIAVYQQRLADAERLQAEGRFDEGLVLLSGMLSTNLAPLEESVEQAKEMLRRLPDRRAQAEEEYLAAVQRAEELADNREYDEAVQVLEATPPGLRDAEAEKRLVRWREHRDEIAALLREIRAAVTAKQTEDLLDKVERLLLLRPDHEQALKLRRQLLGLQQKSQAKTADQVRLQAKALLQAHEYNRAVNILEQIPEPAWDERFRKIYDFARETAWLSASIRAAPIADPALLAAAQRLAKLAPGDAEAAQAISQIQAVLKRGPSDPRQAAPDWKGQRNTALRFPVSWLGGFRRIGAEDAAAATLRAHPGCFYVACGLALQGLGLAAIPTNLAPKKKAGLLDSVSLFSRRRTVSEAWGLDLSVSGLKAVKLVREGEGDATQVKIVRSIHQEQKFDAPAPADEERLLTGMRESLQNFLEAEKPGGAPICVSLAGVQILGRFLQLPRLEDSKLAGAVGYELRHQIPFPVEELAWDFHAFPPPDMEAEEDVVGGREVVLLAAKRYQVNRLLSVFEEAGLELNAVQSDAVALSNFLRFEFASELAECDAAPGGESAIVALDVGRESLNVVACSPNSIWFRTAPLGGDRFTRALVREFRLTFAEAESLKRSPWKARSMQQWDAALAYVSGELLDELRRSEKILGRTRRIDRLCVLGGGARLHGLLRRVMLLAADGEAAIK